MIEIVTLKAEHIMELVKEDYTSFLKPHMTEEMAKEWEKFPYCASILVNGEIAFTGGVSLYWEGRGQVWAMFATRFKANYLSLHRAMQYWLDLCPIKRIEAAISVGDEVAHRRARLLGFQMEAPFMKAYGVGGGDCSLYARVK